MKKSLVRLFCCIALLTGLIALMPESSKGQSTQPVIVKPTELYRFVISFSDGGYMLTGSFQEGMAWGYTPEPLPVRANRSNFPYMGIYVPPSGYTPDPSVGLVALHRWRVIQSGWRNYFYYSTSYSNLGGDYHYEGIQGYVFPPGTATFRGIPLTQMSSWYSQSYGYWNGTGIIPADAGFFIEPPPHSSFVYQGNVCAVPGAVASTRFPTFEQSPTIFDVNFYPPAPPPPPPPGSCSTSQWIKTKCVTYGGWWDDETCSCQY